MHGVIGDSWFIQVNVFDSAEDTRRETLEAFEHRDRTDFRTTAMGVALQLAWSRRGREVVANYEAFISAHAVHMSARK